MKTKYRFILRKLFIMAAGVLVFFGLIGIFTFGGVLKGDSSLDKSFSSWLFSKDQVHREKDFVATLTNDNDRATMEVTTKNTTIKATLLDTSAKVQEENHSLFSTSQRVTYDLANNTQLAYEVLKDEAAPGVISGKKGLKEDIILKDKEAPRKFEFKLDLENISHWENKNNNWYFYSGDCHPNSSSVIPGSPSVIPGSPSVIPAKAGIQLDPRVKPEDDNGGSGMTNEGNDKGCVEKPVFSIPAAFMEDNKGEKSYQVLQEIKSCPSPTVIPAKAGIQENGSVPADAGIKSGMTKEGNDNCATLTIAPDSAWLDDPNRAYPVKIDPTVIVTGGLTEAETQFGGLQRKVVFANNYWYAFYNDGNQILYKKSTDGSNWKAPVNVDSSDSDNYNPTVVLKSNLIYVAWIDDSADAIEVNTIDTSSSDSLGTKCTSADQGSIDTTSFTVSLAVADNGTVYVAYSDTSSDTEADVLKLTYSGCTFAVTSPETTIYLTTADVSPWTVPSDFTSTNTIRAIGGGGAGDNLSTGGGGGGGAAYAAISNLNLGIGSTAPFGVGTGGTDAVNGNPTWFNAANAAACTNSAVCVKAAGGTTATNATGGAGGSIAGTNSVGTTTFAGGDGGTGDATGTDSTGGGGGAASPNGTGGTGGNGDSNAAGEESHGGGGGSGCDSIGSANNGVAGGIDGGNGGDSCFASGGTGQDAANGNPGTRGSGGGGGDEGSGTDDGGNGGNGLNTDDVSRSGGGGGGGDDDSGGVGGNGGLYGGGGGGGATVGTGAAGNIAITYTTTAKELTAGDRPVLTTIGNNLHMIFQDGNLSHSIYNGSTWTTSNTTIEAVTDNVYDVTTDGTNIWVLSLSSTTSTNFNKYTGTWATQTDPFTSLTNALSVSLTYDSTNSDIVGHIITDATEQAYTKTTDATTTAWGAQYSYGFTAGDLSNISSPMTAAGTSQIGVVLRQGSNFEFALSPPIPRLYWKFDDATGATAQDSSTYNLDGTVSDTTNWRTEDFCIFSKCLFFDGANNDNVSKSDDANLDFGATDSFTVEAWVKRNGASTAINYIVSKADTTTGGYKLWMDADGDLCFGIDDDATWGPDISACSDTNGDFDDSKWHHVAGVRSVGSDAVLVYVDGVQKDSQTDPTTATLENTNTFYVGVDRDGTSNEWLGFIDEIKVFAGARTAAQVRSDFNARGTLSSSVNFGNNKDNQPAALANGLVGYWKADEASYTGNCSAADLADSSGNGNTGKTCPNGSPPTVTGGKFGNATNFNGTDDYVEIGIGAGTTLYTPINNGWTMAAWINPQAGAGSLPTIIARGESAPYTLRLNGSTLESIWRFSEPSNVTFDAGTITTNVWTHVVATYDGTTIRHYINGALVGSQADGRTLSFPDNTVTNIGKDGGFGTLYWKGYLDEVRLYNRGLSGADVSSLYNFAPGPVAQYKLDEGSGTSANDTSGNGRTGTINGNPVWSTGKFGKGLKMDGTGDDISVSDF